MYRFWLLPVRKSGCEVSGRSSTPSAATRRLHTLPPSSCRRQIGKFPVANVVSRLTSQAAPAGSCTAQKRPVSNATQEASFATGSDSTDIMAGIHAEFTVHSLRAAASSVQWPHRGAVQQGSVVAQLLVLATSLHDCPCQHVSVT